MADKTTQTSGVHKALTRTKEQPESHTHTYTTPPPQPGTTQLEKIMLTKA